MDPTTRTEPRGRKQGEDTVRLQPSNRENPLVNSWVEEIKFHKKFSARICRRKLGRHGHGSYTDVQRALASLAAVLVMLDYTPRPRRPYEHGTVGRDDTFLGIYVPVGCGANLRDLMTVYDVRDDVAGSNANIWEQDAAALFAPAVFEAVAAFWQASHVPCRGCVRLRRA